MKKAMKNVVLTLLILTLGASTAFLTYLHFFAPGDRDLSGEWVAELDMTRQAAVKALSWLQEMEAVSVSLEDMEFCMQDLTIQVNLSLEQTGRPGGTFHSHILPESYEACRQAAYESLAGMFRKLLAERLHMAGYGGDTDEESIEALVTETFGMSTVSYLMTCGPALLPPLEELQAGYDGSGVYETGDGILIRRSGSGGAVGETKERYIRQGSSLVLSGVTGSVGPGVLSDHYPLIYTLQQSR